ncbi:hypothetical protein IV70_GL003016 [Carnobacterium maltaromaticum DSM 20342]|nr:hypothetical protein IV70_GL003016 [Carnobacterium maltaromaticum DSM 20342]
MRQGEQKKEQQPPKSPTKTWGTKERKELFPSAGNSSFLEQTRTSFELKKD